jgi:CubicO group peptidase (beta-lactamase class C family)
LKDEKLVYAYGDYQLPMNCASVRKSIYSILYGIAREQGIIDTASTLQSISFDDNKQPLTQTEKSARISDLLKARSGIYLDAGGETALMKERKPQRGAFLPNEHFYYNNWDFNALPQILKQQTGQAVEDLIDKWLAEPLGMLNYNSENVIYEPQNNTEHPHSRIFFSAEDLARIGSIVLNYGFWGNQEIISQFWIDQMLFAYSKDGTDEDLDNDDFFEGYGMLWWYDLDTDTWWASGFGGQFIILNKAKGTVTVLMKNTANSVPGFLWNNATSRNEDHESGSEVEQFINQFID